jgi:AcrR family transcriptional regulator
MPGDEPTRLPPGLDLLWGRRGRGKRGPRAGLSADAIVGAAVRLADAEGLEAVSMARVAHELGFTTMSLYRHVASKEELLQLMWNASALGAENLVLKGDGWRPMLRMWVTVQREMMDRHPWVTQMPMAAPPVAPNSLIFVERGLETLDGTGIADGDKLRILGLLSSYTLSEARMAHDAARAARTAAASGGSEGTAPLWTFDALLRELVDEKTYPRLHRIAWSPSPSPSPSSGGEASEASEPSDLSEREEFLFGVDRILDGVQALIDARLRDARLREARAVEVAKEGYLGTVVQDLLVYPPDDVDEDLSGVAAVRVGAQPNRVERGIVTAEQRATPGAGRRGETGDRPGGLTTGDVGFAGQGVAAGRVVGTQHQHLADVAEPPGDGRERRRHGVLGFGGVAAPFTRPPQQRRARPGPVLAGPDGPGAGHRFPEILLGGHRRHLDRHAVAAVHDRAGHPVEQPQAAPVVLLEQGGEAP